MKIGMVIFPEGENSTSVYGEIMVKSMDYSIRSACLGLIGVLLVASTTFGAAYNAGVSAHILKKTTVTGNDQKIAYPKTDNAEVTAMTVDIAPGAATGWHKHPIPVYAYVLAGKLTVEIEGGKSINYDTGEAVIEVVNTLHNGKNNGTAPVQLVVFYLGAEGVPNVIKAEENASR